jgi:anthranilate synthase component 2
MILMIDNYDSFTWNLVQYLGELGSVPRVARHDAVTVADVEAMKPAAIVISPGPGRPSDAGISCALIERFSGSVPILGVCLGMQAMAEHFGGRVVHAPALVHGKTSRVVHEGKGVFAGLPSPFEATRYHSLCVDPASVPDCIEVTARTEDGVIMGLRHKQRPIEGVQFHPEAILTEHGHSLLRNWLGVGRQSAIGNRQSGS